MQPKHMEEEKSRKDQLQAVWFAAGMAVAIACLERAVVLSIVKQWRVWVFLALNLLLIAILFTSTHPPQDSSDPPQKSSSTQENDSKTKKTPPEDVGDRLPVEKEGEKLRDLEGENMCSAGVVVEDHEDSDQEDEKSSALLTNDELNQRVEAFISRFRQQYLVSDVKISRSRSQIVYEGEFLSKTITV